ncbi:MAG TPA: peptide ABC transporter substrate-binding protein [Thermomicrobiales bacterium]|nr:peptide ABC transporter substrate-binding protein [Thermomicrobiales bacterium]
MASAGNERTTPNPSTADLAAADLARVRERARLLGQARLTRRRFLQAGEAVSLAALLAACGGAASTPTPPKPTPNLAAPNPTAPPQVAAPTTAPTAGAQAASPQAQAPTATIAAAASPQASTQDIGKLVLITDPHPTYSGTPTESTDTLNIIRGGDDISDMNPTALNSYSPYTFVYDPLVWIDEYTLDPKPWLATKWEISPDGKSYTFHLRTDVKWHDGTPFTADDVAFSMITYRDDPDSGVARFFTLMKKDPVVVDPATVRFDLDDKSGDWILNASNQFMIQKKQFADYWNAGKGEKGAKTLKAYDYQHNMLVGTGPWKQVQYNPGSAPPYIQYEANPNYFQNKPHFAKMLFKNVDQHSAQITAWLNGETDLLWPVTATDLDQVKGQDGFVYSAYAVAFMNAWINFHNPKSDTPDFLRDKAARQALSTGIDRKGYADAIFKGFVDELKIGSIAFPWAYNTNLKSPDYDQQKAASMLDAAGYKKDANGNLLDKNGKQVKLVAITSNNQQYPTDKIAVSVQEDFKKLGIAMDLQTLESAALKARWQKTYDYDLYFTSRVLFAGFSDLNYYGSDWDVRTNPQGRNFGGWKNADADKLLQQIIREPDLTKQKDLLWQFQAIIADDMPAFWFGFPRDLILVKKNIQGYQPNAMWQYWDTWKLWKTK